MKKYIQVRGYRQKGWEGFLCIFEACLVTDTSGVRRKRVFSFVATVCGFQVTVDVSFTGGLFVE
jgi:hypothetical protein